MAEGRAAARAGSQWVGVRVHILFGAALLYDLALPLDGASMLHDTPALGSFRGRTPAGAPPAHSSRLQPPSAGRATSTSSYLKSHAASTHRPARPVAGVPPRETPWKGTNTPHYIHARPVPSAAADVDGLSAFGEVVTVEATASHTASVIWLHGLGDTGHTWSAVASWLQMPWCRFIFPTAPAQPVSTKNAAMGYAMPSWFDFDSLDIEDVDEGARLYIASAAITANRCVG